MHQEWIRMVKLCAIVLGLGACFVSQTALGQGPCAQIKSACTSAGFVQGGVSAGNGLWRDCIDPIMQGTAQRHKASKPLPQVDPKVIAACKAQDPTFGQPKAPSDTGTQPTPAAPVQNATPVAPASSDKHPNIVFILTDDLAMNLLQYMPHVLQMQKDGVTFANYFVTDSLCCPSRSSIFTGRYPHSTGIFKNQGEDGGYIAFVNRNLERTTFATTLSTAGYRTAMMGKYLNGYLPERHAPAAGWTSWDVAGNGYGEFHYNLNEDGKVVSFDRKPERLPDRRSLRFGGALHQAGARPGVLHRGSDLRAPRTLHTGAARRQCVSGAQSSTNAGVQCCARCQDSEVVEQTAGAHQR